MIESACSASVEAASDVSERAMGVPAAVPAVDAAPGPLALPPLEAVGAVEVGPTVPEEASKNACNELVEVEAAMPR